MPTPRAGTIQHSELEPLYPSYKPQSRVKQLVKEWLIPLAWVLAITLAAAAYNIGACALGRIFLDHFHLWDRRIPSNASSLDKYAELYAPLLASCLSAPVSLGLMYAIFNVEDMISRRYGRFTIVTSLFQLAVLVILVEWTLIPISAAIIHPRYQYVNPASILGVYWFGNLVLLPLSTPSAYFGYLFLRGKD
ncbi:hypothetical protein DL96DRAFT_1616159 [Flagelloscypha sp. PMI_526]|nr:hypothetical protein DL96DRAFT_1616159 [Flagelloscypha sp. PMI_526]